MANVAVNDKLTLTEEERAELVSMAFAIAARSVGAAARIVLACEGGTAALGVARELNINQSTVAKWRDQYARHRLVGLYDKLQPDRPRTVHDKRVAELISTTLHTKPAEGDTH